MNPGSSLRALRAPLRRTTATVYAPTAARAISVSARRLNEAKEEAKDDKKDKKDKEEKKRGWDDSAAPPQSPFKVFLRVFKEEIDKNQGWQQNVKQLQGDVDKMADSEAMKKAREMYERTRVSLSAERSVYERLAATGRWEERCGTGRGGGEKSCGTVMAASATSDRHATAAPPTTPAPRPSLPRLSAPLPSDYGSHCRTPANPRSPT